MGAYLSEPIRDKDSADGISKGGKYAFGSSGMQGWRANMEDAHIHELDYLGDSAQALFCVFDGHGGQEVAKFCEHHLPAELGKSKHYQDGDFGEAMRQSYLHMDEMLLTPKGRAFVKSQAKGGGGGGHALRALEEQMGIKLSGKDGEKDGEGDGDEDDDPYSECGAGCTAVGVLIKDGQLYVANSGDSRIVLCRKGEAVELSTDHKPELQSEKDRIHAGGGFIENGRVNGNLNLTRAIGDFAYKKDKSVGPEKQIITANPDIKVESVTPEDEFIVLGCDGIWELWSSQEMVDFIKPRLDSRKGDEPISGICEEVLDKLLSPNVSETEGIGCDNMTCMIVDLISDRREKGEGPAAGSKSPGGAGASSNPKAAAGLKKRLTVNPGEFPEVDDDKKEEEK